jgi:hypothetical protein
MSHSSHILQPLDLCGFEIFKFLYKTENKVKGIKMETLRIYRAIAAFYKATVIPMRRWSFIRSGFRINSDNLFPSLTVNPEIVLEQIAIPEIPIEELVTPKTTTPQIATNGKLCRRQRIPGPHESAVNLQA